MADLPENGVRILSKLYYYLKLTLGRRSSLLSNFFTIQSHDNKVFFGMNQHLFLVWYGQNTRGSKVSISFVSGMSFFVVDCTMCVSVRSQRFFLLILERLNLVQTCHIKAWKNLGHFWGQYVWVCQSWWFIYIQTFTKKKVCSNMRNT